MSTSGTPATGSHFSACCSGIGAEFKYYFLRFYPSNSRTFFPLFSTAHVCPTTPHICSQNLNLSHGVVCAVMVKLLTHLQQPSVCALWLARPHTTSPCRDPVVATLLQFPTITVRQAVRWWVQIALEYIYLVFPSKLLHGSVLQRNGAANGDEYPATEKPAQPLLVNNYFGHTCGYVGYIAQASANAHKRPLRPADAHLEAIWDTRYVVPATDTTALCPDFLTISPCCAFPSGRSAWVGKLPQDVLVSLLGGAPTQTQFSFHFTHHSPLTTRLYKSRLWIFATRKPPTVPLRPLFVSVGGIQGGVAQFTKACNLSKSTATISIHGADSSGNSGSSGSPGSPSSADSDSSDSSDSSADSDGGREDRTGCCKRAL
uniref:Uncharacterized protein n=2 Tax=Lygus hesperus TaxID=30085 RepID=A0A146LT08_LYGHE